MPAPTTKKNGDRCASAPSSSQACRISITAGLRSSRSGSGFAKGVDDGGAEFGGFAAGIEMGTVWSAIAAHPERVENHTLDLMSGLVHVVAMAEATA